jgi:hypothetical protein
MVASPSVENNLREAAWFKSRDFNSNVDGK